ncbi:MAG TPA: GMC family oxidoreductase, partial [Bacteroidetes bacterium]|nr:GMC family oxidoreductase [Bacteroidota bacterium]
HIVKEIAKDRNLENNFDATKVSVFFDEKANQIHPDPYFDGEGPERKSCNYCGRCMTGCPNNSKNSLDKNYLYFAQKLGVEIIAEHEVVNVLPIGNEGYEISFKKSTKYFSKTKKLTTKGVVFSGGVLGTVSLLLKLKKKSLPNLSEMLGKDVRSNNEALIAVVTPDKEKDFSKGVAIGSILDLDENSHLEPVRYGRGSGFWRIAMMPSVSESNVIKRIFKLFFALFRHPVQWFKIVTVRDFAKQSTFLLFMQNLDSKLQFKRRWFRMSSHIYDGKAPTAFIPDAHQLANQFAQKANGKAMTIFSETLTGIPSTAHILGGAVMGKDKSKGVIDKYNKVFGYDNMYICDGSMISANPGVNPSLSITAITERAMSFIPKK